MIISTQHFTHFDNLIEVDGQTVRLLELPDNLIFTDTSGNGFNGGASGSGAVAVGGRCGEIGVKGDRTQIQQNREYCKTSLSL